MMTCSKITKGHIRGRHTLPNPPDPSFILFCVRTGQEQFSRCGQTFRYRKLLFSLAWFHAILLERRKFKSLGFNVPYEFNESDFSICHDLVIVFLDEVRWIMQIIHSLGFEGEIGHYSSAPQVWKWDCSVTPKVWKLRII